jgi:hypothetical protein
VWASWASRVSECEWVSSLRACVQRVRAKSQRHAWAMGVEGTRVWA